MRKLHRWLLNPPPQKGASSVGKMIVGISTLLMVVILVSGLVIWWPRTRKALNNRLKVSCCKGWRRFWYDSHVALGFYSTLFLLVMALTGLTWSFGWYRSFAYGLLEETLRSRPKLTELLSHKRKTMHVPRKEVRNKPIIRLGTKQSKKYRQNTPAILRSV